MSLDLYEQEVGERMADLRPAQRPDVGVWEGFVRGTGLTTMQGLAKVGRSIDMLGAVGPIVEDAFTGGTEAQDRYFREHDEVWGRAVDYWTPKPDEVGVAGQIAGTLLSTLPLVFAAPSLAVGAMQMGTAEDLVRMGVPAGKAQGAGAAMGLGLGLGIYVPIFGQTLAQRVLAGGVGFNVLQGVGMRGASEAILQGTPAADMFKAFDPTELTLDVLMGAAFGAMVHLSPASRAQSAEAWARIQDWAKDVSPSDRAALMALRQAQHIMVDSMPGKPAAPEDIGKHAARVRQAIEQVVRDEPVAVQDLPAPRYEADEPRLHEMARSARELAGIAEQVRKDEGLPRPPAEMEIPELPGLNPEHRAMESRARAQVLADPDGMLKKYAAIPETDGGKIINTDLARELFPDYNASNETRATNSVAVHEPSSAVAKLAYKRALAIPNVPGEHNLVTFTAGGAGAGKTSAMAAVPLAARIVEASQVVYDGNFSGFRNNAAKIEQALAVGKRAAVIFVGTDPVDAFRRALKRSMKIGRTVRQDFFVDTHRGAINTMLDMIERYQGDDRVQFVFLDNGVGAKGEVGLVDPANARAFLEKINFDDIDKRLSEVLDGERKAGRISEAVYRGVQPPALPRGGEAAGPGGREELAAARQAAAAAQVEPGAPAARPGAAEPPPPGSGRGEAAGAEGRDFTEQARWLNEQARVAGYTGLDDMAAKDVGMFMQLTDQWRQAHPLDEAGRADPLRAAAERVVDENPKQMIKVGEDSNGQPILKTMREYLDDAKQVVKEAREDAGLFQAAAECLFGRA